MTKLLYISPGPVPPGPDEHRDPFSYLSDIATGDVLLPVWWRSPKEVSPYLQACFPNYQVRRFRYHMFLKFRYPWGLRRLLTLFFYVYRGLQLHWHNKFDVIVCYGTHITGIAGVILKWITGAKLIVELPNVPEDQYQCQRAGRGNWTRAKRLMADAFLRFVGGSADCLSLRYPWQVNKYPSLQQKTQVVVPGFVPAHTICAHPSDEKYVLLMGFPWFTKGVDLLIKAFRSIAREYPDYRLKIMGHYPERGYIEELARGWPQIEFLYPRPHEDAMWVMARCTVYALASRTDAAPRVVMEAMAASKPVVASAVGGVPYFVVDNDTGLLFEPGNVTQLADKLRLLLGSPSLRARLGARAHEIILAKFDEESFVRDFDAMLRSVGVRAKPTAEQTRARSSGALP